MPCNRQIAESQCVERAEFWGKIKEGSRQESVAFDFDIRKTSFFKLLGQIGYSALQNSLFDFPGIKKKKEYIPERIQSIRF